MPTIVIEGFDNTGKTTLAKKLAQFLGYNYVSGGGPEVGNYVGALQRLQLGMPNKVQDRTWISEVVYGTVIRKKSGISDDEIMKMIDFHRENKICLIFAKQSYDQVMQNITERDQMDGVVDHAKELMIMYNYYMLNKLPIYLGTPIIYDYTRTSFEDVVSILNGMGVLSGKYVHCTWEEKQKDFNPGGPSLTDN